MHSLSCVFECANCCKIVMAKIAGCVSEHLVLGSIHGDVLVIDADRNGSVVCRLGCQL